MNLQLLTFFNILINFIKNDAELDPDNWQISDFFGSILFFPPSENNIITHTGDPAYWYDWKELVEEEIQKNPTIIDNAHGLTLEQGLVAIQHFLHHRYWLKKNDMLLKDAYSDLVQQVEHWGDKLEQSPMWQEWLAAVEEARKFDKVFKDPEK